MAKERERKGPAFNLSANEGSTFFMVGMLSLLNESSPQQKLNTLTDTIEKKKKPLGDQIKLLFL